MRRVAVAIVSVVLLLVGASVAFAGGGTPPEHANGRGVEGSCADKPDKPEKDKGDKGNAGKDKGDKDKPEKPEKDCGDDPDDPEEPTPEGPFSEIVAFAHKTGFRGVVSYQATQPVAGVVHYGLSPDALDGIAAAPGAPDTAQLVFLDGLTIGETYYFQIEDLLTGETSEIHELVATNSYNDFGPNDQDPTEVSFKPDVYTIDLLVQLDAESLPDDVDPDRSIAEIAQGISVNAERIYDALDGHARIGTVIVTDTEIDHAGTIPGLTPVDFPALCEEPTNRADIIVTTAFPFDSHTFGYAIEQSCTPIKVGRQGQLVVPWEDDLHFGHVVAHEVMHYAFGAPDLYDVGGVGGEPGCRNLDWDGSLMHNTGGWAGDRWELTEVDENPQLTPCSHAENFNPSTWDEIQSRYTEVPSRTVIEDMFNTSPRGNPDGGALEMYLLDRQPGASTLTRFDPSDDNPEVQQDCSTRTDTSTTSFTDPEGDATGVGLGTEIDGGPNDAGLDVVRGQTDFVEGGDATVIDEADALRFTIDVNDLQETSDPRGQGEFFDFTFTNDGTEYGIVTQWDRTDPTSGPTARLVVWDGGRVTLETGLETTWDVDGDTISVIAPAYVPGASEGDDPVFALTPGTDVRALEIVGRRLTVALVLDIDTASGGCPIALPGVAPTPPPPPPPPPADAEVSGSDPTFAFDEGAGTALNDSTVGEIGITADGARGYEIDVLDGGTITVEVTADLPEVNDIDVYLYDATGKQVGSGTEIGGAESFTTEPLVAGRYRLVVVRYATVEAAYSGTLTLAV